jgi:large subunit ribosomal protein L3
LYADNLPKNISQLFKLKNKEGLLEYSEKTFKTIKEIYAIIVVIPRNAGLEQKKPYVFEASVKGGDIKKQFTFVKDLLGKEVKIDQVFESGDTVDTAAITKGKGWEGPITRWGVKRKQHKSRKSVREVGSLGPISPQYVMYTVPRAGQRGLHQRIEYNKKIMVMDNTENIKYEINPKGGFKHFGNVNGDFIIVRGSVPGTYKRLIKLRTQIRNMPKKITKPNILEVVV